MCVCRGRESNLTILSINESHVGANVSCVAVNIVENKEITKEMKTTLLVLSEPHIQSICTF